MGRDLIILKKRVGKLGSLFIRLNIQLNIPNLINYFTSFSVKTFSQSPLSITKKFL